MMIEKDLRKYERADYIVSQTKKYGHAVWLGLLFTPLAIIYAILASSKAKEIYQVEHTHLHIEQCDQIKKGSITGAVVITFIWLMLLTTL